MAAEMPDLENGVSQMHVAGQEDQSSAENSVDTQAHHAESPQQSSESLSSTNTIELSGHQKTNFSVEQLSVDADVITPTGSSEMASTPATSTSSQGSPSMSPLDQGQLRVQLKRQVEYYFSRENLNHDTYLVSQMDSDQYVDISIIANFNQVKKLTSDTGLIAEVLKESACVQVDENGLRVRPLHKRSVVILREIPEGTTQQEIEEIFTHSECPTFISVEYASGDCWYVDFETEEQAQGAFRYIRETLQTFKGKRIMARIKAKATPVSVSSSRPEQRSEGVPPNVEQMRGVPAPASTIRYPVPLPHFPLQNPYQFAITTTPSGHISYIPYLTQHPQLISPPWNHAGAPPVFQDPNFGYDMNGYYPAAPIPNQPPPQQQPAMRNGPGGRGHQQQQSGDRRHHSRANSNGSSVETVSTASQNGTAVSSTPTSSHHTVPTNSKHAGVNTSQSTHYYNAPNHSRGQNHYYKPSSNSVDRPLPTRSKSHAGSISNDHYANIDNIPPRHRHEVYSYRAHKRHNTPQQSSHNQQTSSQQSGNVPPRRQNSAGATYHSQSRNTPSHNTGNNTPHSGRNGTSHEGQGADKPRQHRSGEYANGRPQHSTSDTSSHHHHTSSQHSNRTHGAHHRNSKSPELEEEPSAATIVKSESFELDSSAFPALPGATNDPNPSTATDGANGSPTSISNISEAITTTSSVIKQASAPVEISKTSDKQKVANVAKLSDIVRNNIPAATMAMAVSKGKPAVATHASVNSHNKDTHNDKPVAKSHVTGSHKPHQAQNNNRSSQHGRPTHLTNGVTNHETKGKAPHKSHNSKAVTPSKSEGGTGDKTNTADKAESTKSTPDKLTSGVPKPTNSANPNQTSPTDGGKLSYAAMAQRVAAAGNQMATPKKSPTSPSESSPPAKHGDDNNNAPDSKAAAAIGSKSDNLYSSTAAKTAASVVAANAPTRKPANDNINNASSSTQPIRSSNGPCNSQQKSASGSRSSTGQNSRSSANSSHTPSPTVSAR